MDTFSNRTKQDLNTNYIPLNSTQTDDKFEFFILMLNL